MNEQTLLASIANLRAAIEAGAAVLGKTGLCCPEEVAEIGHMLWEVSAAQTLEQQGIAARALEERAGWRRRGLPMTPGSALRAMRPVLAYTCAQCGAGFAASDQRARYCSNRCRQAAKYAKAKAARAAKP